MRTQLSVASGLVDWFDRTVLDSEIEVAMTWEGNTSFIVGSFSPKRRLLRFAPVPRNSALTKNPEPMNRILASALTRAGWLRPLVDPAMIIRLFELRKERRRIEFIFDTNAMVEGIGHWLVDLFADCCDLVVTAVTLRELQDQLEAAGRTNPVKEQNWAQRLGSRQLYLAANRFRESTGYERVLWRELELDDTALLLSRGAGNKKRSEADTLLLRTVRRSILDRVNGLERFFVTGDTALARRANSELPPGSVIAAYVSQLVPGRTYFPCSWWPGPDEGRQLTRHPARVVWELLAISDGLTLTNSDGQGWALQAFGSSMWPSDYSRPWVIIDEHPSEAIRSAHPTPTPHDSNAIWSEHPRRQEMLDKNLRLSAQTILDLLCTLATTSTDSVDIPESARSTSERKHHTRVFLQGLGLAEVDTDCVKAVPLGTRSLLANAWIKGDHDAVFDVIRGWTPLEEWATLTRPPKRPDRTQETARSLAGLLGQGAHVGADWMPGGGRPEASEIRMALLQRVPKTPPRAVPIYDLMMSVFFRRLKVHPVRAMAVWDRLRSLGVFEDFEPRKGGSSSGRHELEIAELSSSGWRVTRIDIEAYRGFRDLNFRGVPSE